MKFAPYTSGRLKELKVGITSYSEGKTSLNITGNVGIGTDIPTNEVGAANTSILAVGILTAYKLYSTVFGEFTGGSVLADTIVGSALSISGISTIGDANARTLNISGLSTFAGNINANGNIIGDNSTNISGISSVTATSFFGNLTGNVTGNADTATNATTATVATNISTIDESSDNENFVVFTNNATGNQIPRTGSNLTFNASNGQLNATTFFGNLTGTVNTSAQPNITSLGTLSSLNVSGNVSIGGTLTYEDVTNIDSIGLITARSGIKDQTLTAGRVVYVDSDKTLTDSANLIFDGNNLGIGTDIPTNQVGASNTSILAVGILTANRIFSTVFGEFTGGTVTGDAIVGTALSISGISTIGDANARTINVTGISTLGIITSSGDITIKNNYPSLFLVDSDHDDDFSIQNQNGVFAVRDETNDENRLIINSSGDIGIGTNNPGAKLDVFGNTKLRGNVDIDGHTELDNLRVSGISTFGANEITLSNGSLFVQDKIETNGDLKVSGFSTFSDHVTVLGNSTFMGNIDANSDLDVNGHTELDDLNVTGVSTFTGDATFSGNVSIGGTLTYEDVTNIDSVGLVTARSGIRVTGGVIEAQAGENKIPSLYANLAALPSASTYHGMFAHVHSTGRGYFAHAGNWFELVNKESDGTVGTGTERYNIGPVDSTSLNVTGITTLSGDVTLNAGASSLMQLYFQNNITGFGANDGAAVSYSTNSNSMFFSAFETAGNMVFQTGANNVNNRTLLISNTGVVTLQRNQKNMLVATPNSHVKLYYNDTERLSTSGIGITVTGEADVNGNLNISGVSTFGDKVKISSNVNALSSPDAAGAYHLHLTNPQNDTGETVGIAFGLSTGGDIGASITHEREGTNSFGNLRFYTKENANPATMLERMRISKEGNIGINSTSPTSRLDVVGNAQFDGKVLIGTDTEGHANADDLTIATSGDTGITIRSGSSNNGRIYFSDATSGTGEVVGSLDYDHNNDSFSIFTNNQFRLRIDSSGRLLLGTDTEGHPNADDLTIATSGDTGITIRSGTTNNGRIYFSDATSGDGEVVGSLDYDHNNNKFSIFTNNQSRFHINGDGNVGISSNLTVSGILTATSFVGDGSNLTNLPAAGVGTDGSINTTGIITAAQFHGDGSNLTNLPSSGIGTDGSINTTGIITASFFVGDGRDLDRVSFGSTDGNYIGRNFQIVNGAGADRGEGNIILGPFAGCCHDNGYYNVYLGRSAARKAIDANRNVAIGCQAGCGNTNGDNNIFIGSNSGLCNTTGDFNTFIGMCAGENNRGCDNISIGRDSYGRQFGCKNVSIGFGAAADVGYGGTSNVFLGECAGYNAQGTNNRGGQYNFYGGYYVGGANPGDYNIGLGYNALQGSPGDFNSHNIALGCNSGVDVTTGSHNILLGLCSGKKITSGSCNILLGFDAGCCALQTLRNVYIGTNAGKTVCGGAHDIALGSDNFCESKRACNNIAIGKNVFVKMNCDGNSSGLFNIGIGAQVGTGATVGGYNLLLGYQAGTTFVCGSDNIILGRQAGRCSSNSTKNILIGCQAGRSVVTAGCAGQANIAIGNLAGAQISSASDRNIFIGNRAGAEATGGCFNIALGADAGTYVTGHDNVFIGQYAGFTHTISGNSNVVIGKNVCLPSASGSTQLAIGAGATHWISGDSSFNVGIGTTNPTSKLHLAGSALVTGVSTFSDSVRIGDNASFTVDSDADNLVIGEASGNNGVGNHGITILSGTTSTGSLFFEDSSGNVSNVGSIQYDHGADAMKFGTAGGTSTEKMRITSAGDVGIGTDNPARDFHVVGTSRFEQLDVVGFTTFGGSGTKFFHHIPRIEMQGSNTAQIQLTNATSGTTLQDGLVMGFSSGGKAGFININESGYGFILKTGGSATTAERINVSGVGTVSIRKGTTEEMITARPDGAVELYFNANKKFETTSSGSIVTGILTATSFEGDGSNLSNLPGITTSSDPSFSQVEWDVVNNGASSYRFTGPGNDGAEDNPDIYLVRGQKYTFDVNASGHPFKIRVSSGGSDYSDGVINNGAETGKVIINVQHDAPAQLVYQCQYHGGMVGNIYIVGQHLANGANNRLVTATSAYGLTGETDLTYDGTYFSMLGSGYKQFTMSTGTGNSVSIKLQNQTKNFTLTNVTGGKFQIAEASVPRFEIENGHTTIPGSVSIGGTLTYEDVTNVDSIGIITARNGIDCNGDLDVDGRSELDIVNIAETLNVSGIATFNQNVIIPDNKKILFGTDDDLQIYHDTTYNHGFIKETGAGGLIFATSVLEVYNAAVSEKMITANQNAGIELYHNNVKKFETSSSGAIVTGILTATSFVGDGSNLTNLPGISTSSDPSFSQVEWDVVNNGASAYRFTGPGNDGAEDNPDLYLVRGQKYTFNVNASGHPFKIRVSNGGSDYSDGVINNGAETGSVILNVQHDAPAQLFYQCQYHGGMVGNIYIVGGAQIITGITTFGSSGQVTIDDNGNVTSTNRITATAITITDGQPGLVFEDTGANPDFILQNRNGSFAIRDITSNANRFFVDAANGDVTVTGNIVGDNSTNISGINSVTATSFFGDGSSLTGISTSGDIVDVTGITTTSGTFNVSAGVSTNIDSFAYASADYKTAEYTLHFMNGSDIQAQKLLVMRNGTTAFSEEYGVMSSSGLLVSVGATVSSGNVLIQATPETGVSGVTTYRWRREVQL